VLGFLLARMAVAPLGPLDLDFRSLRGRVLSLGCGHGAVDRYLAEINPEVTIDGVDLDEERVELARATEAMQPRVRVRVADVRELQREGGYDAAIAIDVLHHVDASLHGEIASALHDALRPGGTLLVKEMATTPRRQYAWNRMHDRIVAKEDIHCRSPQDMARVIEAAGFEIDDVRRLKRLRIYPQYLVAGRRRG
jgi:cyclopropane fatty-acyl-phospholipid synthase-like methyltransferase